MARPLPRSWLGPSNNEWAGAQGKTPTPWSGWLDHAIAAGRPLPRESQPLHRSWLGPSKHERAYCQVPRFDKLSANGIAPCSALAIAEPIGDTHLLRDSGDHSFVARPLPVRGSARRSMNGQGPQGKTPTPWSGWFDHAIAASRPLRRESRPLPVRGSAGRRLSSLSNPRSKSDHTRCEFPRERANAGVPTAQLPSLQASGRTSACRPASASRP